MIFLTRKETFSAAHKLYREDWTQSKNEEVFGKCANPNWHGHNYELYVTVKGEPDPATSFVMNLSTLSDIIKENAVNRLDHMNINIDVDFMKGKIATTENLIVAIWQQIEPPIRAKKCILHCIRIQETEKNYLEYFGP